MDKKNIRVLMIEDNLGDARLIHELLSEVSTNNFEIEWADTFSKGLEYLSNNNADIILLDLSLPDSGGIETFMKLHAQVSNIPIVVLSGLDDERIAIKAVQEGAQDYLVKGQVDGSLIARALQYSIERKHTEEALREAKSFTESIISNVPEVIYSVNDDMKISYISPKCKGIYGYSSEEFKNDPTKLWMDVIHPDDRNIMTEFYDKLRKGEAYSFEYKIIDKNGNTRWVHDSGIPSLDMESRVKRLEGSITDITERKQMETELKRYTEHLEEEVKQRTNELIQSEKMAAIGLLLTGVAHEINNPLGYINSNSEIIKEHLQSFKEDYYDDKTLQIINEMSELIQTNIMGVNRIITITKSLRRFALPDKGQIAKADINQGLKDTLTILHNQLKHRIEVFEDYNEIPNLKCNIGQLNQVFMNLILNSSQAMDKGKIWIKTWSYNKKIFIEIKDNGKGIDTEKINRIFDPFFTTKETGTGLGLSLSYRIIKDHNGNIKADSKLGEGTKMLIELPLEV